jgi:alpha-glucosidase
MKWLLTLACLSLVLPVTAQKAIRLSSPNGQLAFSFRLVNKKMQYDIAFKGNLLVEQAALGLQFEDRDFINNLQVLTPVFREADEQYELVVGKTKQVRSHYKEVTIPVLEPTAPHRLIHLIVRAFDDGIAFRYEYPQQKNWSSYTLLEENTSFRLAGDPMVRALFLPSFTSSHEGEYSLLPFSRVKEDTLMDMPALFEFSSGVYMAVTEAALSNYAGMYLVKHDGQLTGKLSPLPGQTAIKVKATLPHHTPWRVCMISDRIGALIESNILTSLCEPSKINDVTWLKPGKTTFPWWNGNVVPDSSFAPGNNFETNKYYIDFCARNGIAYHSVVEYGLHEWYVNDGGNFQPGPHADVTTPVPGLDMKEICDYAARQGVGIRVWVHWAALYPKLDTAFAVFEKWGLKGMMVDFMDRDDQEMVNIQEEILQKAAKHHLHIQFHGAYKPSGLHRTYPNEFTREGTLNYEVNKWEKRITPDHDINIPFVRMLAGSTDYHLGGFRAVPDRDFKVQYTRPLMLGTRCHMLAMYVVLENYLGMVCDYPAAYEGEPGFDFIKEVPTVWDETKVLDARPGEYIIIARRKNDDWYIGAITNSKERQLSIPLNFLDANAYLATIYSDAPDASQHPNHLLQQSKNVKRSDSLAVTLAAGGGLAVHLKK